MRAAIASGVLPMPISREARSAGLEQLIERIDAAFSRRFEQQIVDLQAIGMAGEYARRLQTKIRAGERARFAGGLLRGRRGAQ